jgi:uncharacterized cupin superfamily protein
MSVPEARIAQTEHGLAVESEGWFVLNAADARWIRNERGGEWCTFESREARFPEVGVNIHVLQPGQPNAAYHSESTQEDFLVLSGECILLVEGQERRLRAWDFVHCPGGTHHVFVGVGDSPCAILMIGARGETELHYPADELAAKYGASSPKDTADGDVAYRDWPHEFTPVPADWPLRG